MPVRVSWRNLLDSLAGVAYLVDGGGCILAIGPTHWRRFAKENGGAAIADETAVIGRNLFDFIAGSEVADSYRQIIERLRADPTRAFQVPIRCDAPATRRDVQMLISAVASNGRRKPSRKRAKASSKSNSGSASFAQCPRASPC